MPKNKNEAIGGIEVGFIGVEHEIFKEVKMEEIRPMTQEELEKEHQQWIDNMNILSELNVLEEEYLEAMRDETLNSRQKLTITKEYKNKRDDLLSNYKEWD
jgi:hypothetical protein